MVLALTHVPLLTSSPCNTCSNVTARTPEWVRKVHEIGAEVDAQTRMFERQTLGLPVPLSDVSDVQLASRFAGCSLTVDDKAQQLSLASIVIGEGRSRCLKYPAGGDPAGGDAPEVRREHREGADQWRRRCASLSPQTPLLEAWTTLVGVKVRRAACTVLPRRAACGDGAARVCVDDACRRLRTSTSMRRESSIRSSPQCWTRCKTWRQLARTIALSC